MAPITRSQAANSLLLTPQNGHYRVRKRTSPVSLANNSNRTDIVVIEDDPITDGGRQWQTLQDSIVERELRGAVIYLQGNVCKGNIDHGLTKRELLTGIKRVLRERNYGDFKLERRITKIQTLLKAAAMQTDSHQSIMSPGTITERLSQQLYQAMQPHYQAPSSQTLMDNYMSNTTNTASDDCAIHLQSVVVKERTTRQDSMIVSNERKRTANLTFRPKAGRDVTVEFALLEILGTLGRDSLDDINYEDFVRVVQVVKQEKLAQIKLEIHWDPMDA